jgi:hypothetical protein
MSTEAHLWQKRCGSVIYKFKKLFLAKTHGNRDEFPILRALRYLFNVLLVAGTVGVLALGSYTKSRTIPHDTGKAPVSNRAAPKGAR